MATTYAIIALLVFVLAILFALTSAKPAVTSASTTADKLAQTVWPFAPMPFLTPAEVRFFNIIKQAVPECHIFAQVQLSQLIQVSDLDDEKFWLNRISRMSIDFVVVQPDCQTVFALIELDDWTHERKDRVVADAKKDKAIISAGLRLFRYHGNQMPTPQVLRRELLTR